MRQIYTGAYNIQFMLVTYNSVPKCVFHNVINVFIEVNKFLTGLTVRQNKQVVLMGKGGY